MGYPSVLTAKNWGFYDVLFKGQPFTFQRPYESYVMENVLFKISYPAEFHAQTAVECAIKLHGQVKDRLEDIDKIVLTTHESAVRIISKTGPLYNPADRDHCLQYMVAIGLIFGELTADYYEDKLAADERIDQLRAKMTVVEDKKYSADYLDPEKRSIANAIQVYFKDGRSLEKIAIEYPLGHRRRRKEGKSALLAKFTSNLATRFPAKQVQAILTLCENQKKLAQTPVNEFMDLWVI
jgi:2-methylcitrate dehydratase